MREIKLRNETVAIIHTTGEWKEGLDFLTSNESFIQASTWWYPEGKVLKAHRHVLNTRTIDRTQETVIVLSGSIRIDFYDESNVVFHKETVKAGDICIILTAGHGYYVLEDNTRVVEVKNGPFTSVEKDKELI
jgi:NMD protein affecting ribosome stability and mRNA decay